MIEHVPVRFSAACASTAVGALLLAGCGAAAEPDSAEPSVTPINTCAPVSGVTADSVTIAVVFPQSGPAAAVFKNFGVAAQLRVDELNRKEGVNGRRIILRLYDDRNSSQTQKQVGKQLLSDGVFGVIAASQQQSMYPELAQAGVPVTGFPNLPPYGTDLNVFGAFGAFSTTYASTAAAQRFKRAKARSVAVVTANAPGALSAADGFIASLLATNLTQAGSTYVINPNTKNLALVAAQIKSSGAKGVNVISLVGSGTSLLKSLKSQNATPVMTLINGLVNPKDVLQADGALDGAVGAPYGFVPLQLDHAEVKRYVAGMAAKGVDPYSLLAPIGYVSSDLMATGLAGAGECPNRADFIRILRGVSDYLGAGLLPGKVSFTPGVTPDGDPQKCTWFLTVRGESILPDDNATCGVLINSDSK
ncbi:MAG: ABC transporter substrate-binding protein [Actinomycetota bacterium]|nr:ABC transporter substrate-binding protein [Actinomycetota bacterium]